MKRLTLILTLVILLTSLSSCRRQSSFSESFFLMDTLINVTLYTENAELADGIFSDCRTMLTELDALWARQKNGSDVARFNLSSNGIANLDPRTDLLLQKALAVSQHTDGAFDITVAPLVDLWQTAGEQNLLPSQRAMAEALHHVGYEKLTLKDNGMTKGDPSVQIDLGGIGKGGATDLLIAYLEECEVVGGMVSFGSNVAVFGQKPNGEAFRIALRDPKNASGTVGTLSLSENCVLSVSGDYERYVTVDGQNYHHILDTKTGYPAKAGLSSVAVIAEDGALADALSTAFFVMGEDETLAFYQKNIYTFEAILIGSDGHVTVTDGLFDCFIAE